MCRIALSAISRDAEENTHAPNEQARRNHEELFPGHVSRLAVTHPELIEVFDNFAFDEVLRHSRLNPRMRLMVQLAALTAGVTPVEAKEIAYHAVPYVGMGRVFDFLHITNDVLTARDPTPTGRAVHDDTRNTS